MELISIRKYFLVLVILVYTYTVFISLPLLIKISIVSVNYYLYMIQWVVCFFFLLLLVLSNISSKNIYYVIIFVFTFQIVCSFFLLLHYLSVDLPFGYEANDALVYEKFAQSTKFLTIKEAVHELMHTPRLSDLSDWGYSLFKYFCYRFFPETGIFVLIFCNIFLQTVSSFFVYWLASFFFTADVSLLASLLWGTSGTSIYVNVSGLKETIFAFLVICSVYNLVKFYNRPSLVRLILFFVFTTLTWFFRNYVTLFLIVIFIFCTLFYRIYHKYFFFLILSIFFLAFCGMDFFSSFLPELKFVNNARNMRLEEFFGSSGIFANTLNFILAWFSPFPRFDTKAQAGQLIYTSYSIFKVYFSFFEIYGIFRIIKNKEKKFYPLVTFLACNTALVIVTCNSLDFRFLHPASFIDILLILYGFQLLCTRGFYIFEKKISFNLVFVMNIFVVSLLVIFYNYR